MHTYEGEVRYTNFYATSNKASFVVIAEDMPKAKDVILAHLAEVEPMKPKNLLVAIVTLVPIGTSTLPSRVVMFNIARQ